MINNALQEKAVARDYNPPNTGRRRGVARDYNPTRGRQYDPRTMDTGEQVAMAKKAEVKPPGKTAAEKAEFEKEQAKIAAAAKQAEQEAKAARDQQEKDDKIMASIVRLENSQAFKDNYQTCAEHDRQKSGGWANKDCKEFWEYVYYEPDHSKSDEDGLLKPYPNSDYWFGGIEAALVAASARRYKQPVRREDPLTAKQMGQRDTYGKSGFHGGRGSGFAQGQNESIRFTSCELRQIIKEEIAKIIKESK